MLTDENLQIFPYCILSSLQVRSGLRPGSEVPSSLLRWRRFSFNRDHVHDKGLTSRSKDLHQERDGESWPNKRKNEKLTQESLVDMCCLNLQTKLQSKMNWSKPKTLGALLEVAVEAEMVVKAREQEKMVHKGRPSLSQRKRKDGHLPDLIRRMCTG